MLLGLILIMIGIPIVAVIFMLAQHKEEIWEHIEFKDGDNNE